MYIEKKIDGAYDEAAKMLDIALLIAPHETVEGCLPLTMFSAEDAFVENTSQIAIPVGKRKLRHDPFYCSLRNCSIPVILWGFWNFKVVMVTFQKVQAGGFH